MSSHDSKAPQDNYLKFDDLVIKDLNVQQGGLSSEDNFSQNFSVFNEFDWDPKYRSIDRSFDTFGLKTSNLASNAPILGSTPFNELSRPKPTTQAPRRDTFKHAVKESSSQAESKGKSKSKGSSSIPVEPFYVAPATHFKTQLDFADIKSNVETELVKHDGMAFDFFDSKFRWEAVFMKGSTRCKFEVNVYKRTTGGFVVEGNRLSGDGMAFVNIFKSIRGSFDGSSDRSVDAPLTSPPARRHANVEEFKKSLDAVLSMSNSGIGESQLSAAQILCDLSIDHSKHAMLVENNCIPALMMLRNVKFEACDQHAISALANMSSSQKCQEILLQNTEFLQDLFPLCSDGNYNSTEMRRESARVLANISSNKVGAKQVVDSAGLNKVESWLQTVNRLQDGKLRTYAEQAKASLAACM